MWIAFLFCVFSVVFVDSPGLDGREPGKGNATEKCKVSRSAVLGLLPT